MRTLMQKVQNLIKLICSIALALMATIVLIQVINRNVFDGSFKWVEELSTMCMVCITFLGAALATSMNAHTRIELFVNLLPKPLPSVVFTAGDLLCAAFCIALLCYGWPLVVENLHTMSPAMKAPLAINYLFFSAAMALNAAYLVLRCIDRLGHKEEKDGAEAADAGEKD